MEKSDLYYNVARDRFQYQDSLHKDFGTKAINLVGFGGALVAAGGLIMRLSGQGMNTGPSDSALSSFIALGVFFSLAAGFGIWTIWPRDWRHNPAVNVLKEHLSHYGDQALVEWTGDEYAQSIEHNQPRLDQMARLLRLTMFFVALEVLALAALTYLSF